MQALKEVWCNEHTDRAPEEDGVVVREGIAQDAGGGERERGGYLVFGDDDLQRGEGARVQSLWSL